MKSCPIEESYSNIPQSISNESKRNAIQAHNKNIRRDMLIRLSKGHERRYKEEIGLEFPHIIIHSETQNQTTTKATVECETVL